MIEKSELNRVAFFSVLSANRFVQVQPSKRVLSLGRTIQVQCESVRGSAPRLARTCLLRL
jgi:hypothetical protein